MAGRRGAPPTCCLLCTLDLERVDLESVEKLACSTTSVHGIASNYGHGFMSLIPILTPATLCEVTIRANRLFYGGHMDAPIVHPNYHFDDVIVTNRPNLDRALMGGVQRGAVYVAIEDERDESLAIISSVLTNFRKRPARFPDIATIQDRQAVLLNMHSSVSAWMTTKYIDVKQLIPPQGTNFVTEQAVDVALSTFPNYSRPVSLIVIDEAKGFGPGARNAKLADVLQMWMNKLRQNVVDLGEVAVFFMINTIDYQYTDDFEIERYAERNNHQRIAIIRREEPMPQLQAESVD